MLVEPESRFDVSSRLRAILRVDPTAPAIHSDGVWDSWGDLDEERAELSHRLSGIPVRAPIALIARNRPETVGALIALLAEHRSVHLLSELQQTEALRAEIADLRPAAVVGAAVDLARDGVAGAAESVGAVVVEARRGESAGASRDNDAEAVDESRDMESDVLVAVSLKTSGSTGRPRRVELSYGQLSTAIAAVDGHHAASRSEEHMPQLKRGTTIQMLSLGHISSILSICTTVAGGRNLALIDRFEPFAWASAVRDHAVVTTGLPPAAVEMVLVADIPTEWLETLRAVRVGSAPISMDTATRFENTYDVSVLRAYGATELQTIASWTLKDYLALKHEKQGAVGRALPGVGIRIVDPKTGVPMPYGETGVLEVRTKQSSAATEQPDSWLRTNDLGHCDADRFLWIDGRNDNAINRGGFKIDPSEVASVLRSAAGVREAVVFAAPDARLGEVPVAAVTRRDTGATPTQDDLRAWVRARLEPYKVPVQFAILDEMPMTAAMKPDRQQILNLLGYDT